MSEPLESATTALILRALRAKGGHWVKTHGSPYSANSLDIVGCYKGRYVALEVKRPSARNSTTMGQEAVIQKIRAAGGIAEVVVSPGEALRAIGAEYSHSL